MGGKELVFSFPAVVLVAGVGLMHAVTKNPETIREATVEILTQLMKNSYLGSTTLKKKAFSLNPRSCLGFP